MAKKLTEKENYMMLLRGEQPEWVPHYVFGPNPLGKATPVSMVGPSFLHRHLFEPGVRKDIWGVTYVPVPEANDSKIPEPNNFILKDIRKWCDVIKARIFQARLGSNCQKGPESLSVSREETALAYGLMSAIFSCWPLYGLYGSSAPCMKN